VLSVDLLTSQNLQKSMARRYSMALRPIHRIKHVIDVEGNVTSAGSVTDLIISADAPTLGSTNSVETGSKVNGIYLHIEVLHSAGAGRPNIYMYVIKNPGGNLTLPSAKAIGASDNKRFVIHQEMIMMSGDAGNGLPRPLFNGVIVIPKGYRRFGPNDKLQVSIVVGDAAITADMCLQCHYKEFR